MTTETGGCKNGLPKECCEVTGEISPEVFEVAVAEPGVGVQRDGLEVGERHEDLLAQRAQVVVVHAHGLHAVFKEIHSQKGISRSK